MRVQLPHAPTEAPVEGGIWCAETPLHIHILPILVKVVSATFGVLLAWAPSSRKALEMEPAAFRLPHNCLMCPLASPGG